MFGLFKKLDAAVTRRVEDRVYFGMSIKELVEFRTDVAEDKKHLIDTEILNVIRENGLEGIVGIDHYVENPVVTSL